MIENHRLTGAQFLESPNHGGSLEAPTVIVAHYTAGHSAAKSAQWLCSKQARASAHIIIGRAGELYQLVPFNVIAWHAGTPTHWRGKAAVNSFSIGIELDNPGPVVKDSSGAWRALALGRTFRNDEVVVATHPKSRDACGWVTYTPIQLAIFEHLCHDLIAAYPTLQALAGHEDVKVAKLDPGPLFPKDHLSARLFGRS